jgi:translation initiation factor eIF-2B subunit delta
MTHKVKLFNHLYTDSVSLLMENKLKYILNIVYLLKKFYNVYFYRINSGKVHPSFIKLGVQMRNCVVAGSNARCLAFLYALRQVC